MQTVFFHPPTVRSTMGGHWSTSTSAGRCLFIGLKQGSQTRGPGHPYFDVMKSNASNFEVIFVIREDLFVVECKSKMIYSTDSVDGTSVTKLCFILLLQNSYK